MYNVRINRGVFLLLIILLYYTVVHTYVYRVDLHTCDNISSSISFFFSKIVAILLRMS